MRVIVKGGVWKNTEDEILKAAVMKYGMNNWSRVASLLNRKSAKQCKARWYEWLDPSIKKTEWTREEEEKLLHLAKLMPTQWRTIAPMIGRTPAQCLEHYERLLDQAQGREADADDPRRLRPGEIDPNPETKPARPDPIDMEEDEKEMLSEAKARLANTKGKKAKRKAREKQLQEARRLALLQKKREMKAAGIEAPQRRHKKKYIDYNAEIPFHRKPAPGFFDTSDERKPSDDDTSFKPIDRLALEGKSRSQQEADQRKRDEERQKKRKELDLPSAIMRVNEMNDPEPVRKRQKMVLPTPQVSDAELEDIAKVGYSADLEAAQESQGATRDLLGSYGTPTPGRTPMRTPAAPSSSRNAIMNEAENIIALNMTETPLMGGENTPLHQSDFTGITPQRQVVATPNALATPYLTPAHHGGGAPASEHGGATPMRDGLAINTANETSMDDTARSDALRKALRAGLTSLPAPKNEYAVALPEVPQEPNKREAPAVVDAEDEARAARRAAAEAREAELQQRSSALQRGLPRPRSLPERVAAASTASASAGDDALRTACALVAAEMRRALEHDEARYPLDPREPFRPAAPLAALSEDDAARAAALIDAEAAAAPLDIAPDTLAPLADRTVFVPSTSSFVSADSIPSGEMIAVHAQEFARLHELLKAARVRAAKLEKKYKILSAGYEKRAGSLRETLTRAHAQGERASIEVTCFTTLRQIEKGVLPQRIEELETLVSQAETQEAGLQSQYARLAAERTRLQNLLESS